MQPVSSSRSRSSSAILLVEPRRHALDSRSQSAASAVRPAGSERQRLAGSRRSGMPRARRLDHRDPRSAARG